MTAEEERARTFLDEYREVFESFDAEAVADHFAYPCLIVGDNDPVDLRAVEDRTSWVAQLEGLMDVYRGAGIRRAEVLDSSSSLLTPRALQVLVHWSLRGEADSEIYDFHAAYTLVEDGGSLRIAAIVHDELPKIMELLSTPR